MKKREGGGKTKKEMTRDVGESRIFINLYVYIYREREREMELSKNGKSSELCTTTSIFCPHTHNSKNGQF